MSLSICHNSPAPNYGDRVPVDTTLGRVPMYTAPRAPHNRDINHQAKVLQPSRQEVQLWELKCLPTDLHLCSCSNCTATHALQIGLEVVVVVGAKNATAADPVLEHANTLNNVLVLDVIDGVFPFIGFTLSQAKS